MAITVTNEMEINGASEMEVVLLTSTANDDVYFSKKFHYIRALLVQNHGATFSTGVARDEPKVVITQGNSTANAKITITHTATTEVFSIFLFGDK